MERQQIENKLKPMVGNCFTYRESKFILLDFIISTNVVKLQLDDRSEDWVIHKDDLRGIIDQFYPAQKEASTTVSVSEKVNPYLDRSPSQSATMPKLIPAAEKAALREDRLSKTLIGQNAAWMGETIKANIEKVQKDPSYIPQAESVNNQVKSFLDICKTEVEMLKAIKGLESAI